MKQLLYYASLAGSSHNTQPWKVTVYGNDSIQLHLDSQRTLPAVDTTLREVYISVGAFLENFVQAADCMGYQTTLTVHDPTKNHAQVFASVKLSSGEYRKNDAGLNAIRLRRTLRTAFDTISIHPGDLQRLMQKAEDRLTFFPMASREGKYISKNNLAAYIQQVQRKEAQDELANWVRFSNKDAATHQDGLTPASMGITGIKGWFASHFLKPKDINSPSSIKQGIKNTAMQVEHCAGWLVISGKYQNNELEEWIHAGRIYERLNIECRSLKIGFQPVSQILEEEPFAGNFRKELDLRETPLMVIRIGYVNDYPEPVSLRRPVDSFTIFK